MVLFFVSERLTERGLPCCLPTVFQTHPARLFLFLVLFLHLFEVVFIRGEMVSLGLQLLLKFRPLFPPDSCSNIKPTMVFSHTSPVSFVGGGKLPVIPVPFIFSPFSGS